MKYAIMDFIKRGFDFNGRTSRKNFWLTYLFFLIVAALFGGFTANLFGSSTTTSSIFVFIFFILTFSLSVRRLHDTNRSGMYILLSLIPLIGNIILLVFYLSSGTPGPNKYGEPDIEV